MTRIHFLITPILVCCRHILSTKVSKTCENIKIYYVWHHHQYFPAYIYSRRSSKDVMVKKNNYYPTMPSYVIKKMRLYIWSRTKHDYNFCCLYQIAPWWHHLRHWSFVRGIHRSPVNSTNKGQWCGFVIFSLICAWTNGGANHWDAGDFRRHGAHYDITVMTLEKKRSQTYHLKWPQGHAQMNNIVQV